MSSGKPIPGHPGKPGVRRPMARGVTLPEVCPQKKKRLDCLMMVMPGTSTVYWEAQSSR